MFDKKHKFKTFTVGNYNDGDWIDNSTNTHNFEKADIIIFPGGIDVSPTLYGENRGKYTQVGKPSQRDIDETKIYKEAIKAGKYIVGICRGLQLLTVLNGGKLVQHMNHNSGHIVDTFDGQKCYTNSLHHQLAYPWDIPQENWDLIMWTKGLSNTYLNGNDEEIEFPHNAITDDGYIIEPEGIFFPKTKTLAVQWHPEMMGYNKWFWNIEDNLEVHTLDWLNNLIQKTFTNPNYIKELKLQNHE